MNLFPTFRLGDLDLAAYPFSVRFGKDMGSPAQVVAEVQSALRDGSLTQVTRYDNREVSIPIMIEGTDLLALAEAEALLVAEAMKPRNEFTFNPGDGFAVDSVYDTYTASLTPEYDDEHDSNIVRLFTLTFPAHPWPRSADLVVTPASATAAATVVNDGSSTAGWSSSNGTVTTASGAVVSTYDSSVPGDFGASGTTLVLTGPTDTSIEGYIGIDWKSSRPAYYAFREQGGSNLAEVRREPVAGGYTRSWYKAPDESLSALVFGTVHPVGTGSATLSITQVVKAATLPNSGTLRQVTRTLNPGGSVPAEGAVKIEKGSTEALGHTIVYSHPAIGGYSPPLRPWLVESDPVTADSATTLSGSYNALTNLSLFRVPATSVPKGDVQLWARLNKGGSAGSVSVQWVAQSALSTTGGIGDTQEGFTLYNFAAPDTWYLVPLARLTLPVAPVGPAGFVAIGIKAPGLILDEAWLFAMDEGRLTIVDCGRGTPSPGFASNRLRISAPSPDEPNGSIMVATAADWSDAYVPPAEDVLCDQTGHRFDPAGAIVFTVIDGNLEPSVSFEHYPRWHTNAGV